MSLHKDYEKIVSTGMSSSLFGIDKYESYYKNSLKAKEKIREKMGNKNKIIFPIEDEVMTEHKNKEFKTDFRIRLKDYLGVSKEFFAVVKTLPDANLLDNSTPSGMKYTKFLKNSLLEDDISNELIDELVLLYSQIKNSYIMPRSYFVVSIEPIDFILMGIGKGWKTCYSPNYGEHFTGSFSIGLDEVSYLTYFTTDPTGEDNNRKIYRRLGVFTEDYKGSMLSTQYPYKNSSFEDVTKRKLKELFFNNESSYVEVHDKDIKTYKKTSSQVYNDFVSSPNKENLYIGTKREEKTILYHGSVVQCFGCAQRRAKTDVPFCAECYTKKVLKGEF